MGTETYTTEQQAIIDNFRNRFENARYRKAVEEAAKLDWRTVNGSDADAVIDPIAAEFDQGCNTVIEDVLWVFVNGEHRAN